MLSIKGGAYGLLLTLPTEQLYALTVEDGLIENVGALFYLGASVAALIAFFASGQQENRFFWWRVRRNIYFLLLAAFFFVCFGEEISFGASAFLVGRCPKLSRR